MRWLCNTGEIGRIVLLSGARVAGLSEATRQATESITLPDFDYDTVELRSHPGDIQSRVTELVRQWEQQMQAMGISPTDTVVHWHNHSLGKNAAASGVIQRLAASGWRFLLQIHDFAEDNRPENYAHLIRGTRVKSASDLDAVLYPVASQIHYATLTQLDANMLTRIGVPAQQTHCLPNSVAAATTASPDRESALRRIRKAMGLPTDAQWCLYPVRGIRRKNVGEFLLVSQLMPPDCYAGLTLCPTTPVERRSYERWRQAAHQLAPRSIFDAAHHPDITFADNLAACRFVLSTSVAEGFGMAFLEPWLSHREVIARRLESVSADFENTGVRLPKLYDSIPIPGNASWIHQCQQESAAMLAESWRVVPELFRPNILPETCRDQTSVDFARLTPQRQLAVLQRMVADPGFDAEVRKRSAQLIDGMQREVNAEVIQHNARVIEQHYSLAGTGKKLHALYLQIAAAPTDSTCKAPSHAGSALQWIHAARPPFPCRMERLNE